MYGIYDDPYQGKFIVMEFMEERSLDKFLQIKKSEIKLKALIDFCSQVSLGMIYLSSKLIIHRDLAGRFQIFFNEINLIFLLIGIY